MSEELERIISAWAFAHDIDGAVRNDLFARLRAQTQPAPPADVVEAMAKAISKEAGAMWPMDANRYRRYAKAALSSAPAGDALEALREARQALGLHVAWARSENSGPDYGQQTRETHPDGERIWLQWWNNNLDLCDGANTETTKALARIDAILASTGEG